jgi:hypothetical protein
MSRFYSGESTLGICNACGGHVRDGGQSGPYCETPRCPNSYYGTSDPPPRLTPVNDVFMVSFPHSEGITREALEEALRGLSDYGKVVY